MEPQFLHFDHLPPFVMAPGVTGRALFGEQAMINLVELGPGALVASHSHPHEQLGLILRGQMVLVVDGVEHPLGPMEAYALPGGIEHSGRGGPDGATVLDVFRPIREEYRSSAGSAGAARVPGPSD